MRSQQIRVFFRAGVGGYRGSDEGGWQKAGLPRRRGFMEAGLPQALEQ